MVQTALTRWCFCCCCCWWCSLFMLLMRWFFEKKCRTKMKLKFSVSKTEQKNCGNAHSKYNIPGFNRHLTYDVAVVLFFLRLLRWFFENKCNTKMKLKISREWTEQNNGRSADRKYAIGGYNSTYPLLLLLLLLSFLCSYWRDCLNKNSTPKFLTQN